MIEIKHNYSLQKLNTFGLKVFANEYIKYNSVNALKNFINQRSPFIDPIFFLGGGSNLLFKDNFKGIILHSFIKGIEIVEEKSKEVLIRVGAGENWDDLVQWTVDKEFYGLENLSLIPGHVGAAPIQNIGAYGVEVKDTFEKAEGVWFESGKDFNIDASEMQFDYRHSVFKDELRGKVILTYLYFRLSKEAILNLDYGSVNEAVKKIGDLSQKNVRKAIIQIRSTKLPDPSILGNAGSFFKNPIVAREHFTHLKKEYAKIPHYFLLDSDKVKVPAGWLIQQCGWKGKGVGDAAVHTNQALVLVNKGNATGADLIQLAQLIEKNVYDKFSIQLEKEVTIISSST